MDCFFDDIGDVVDVFDQIVVLGDRHGDARNVCLLKGILAQDGATHLTTNCQQRRTVHPRIGNGCHQIRRAGTAGADTDTNSACRTRIPFGCMACTLLVTTQDVPQIRAVLPHCMIERHDCAAWDAKHGIDTILNQCFTQNLSPGTLLRHTSSICTNKNLSRIRDGRGELYFIVRLCRSL